MYFAFRVVPIELNFDVFFSFEVDGDVVILLQCIHEVVQVGFLDVFNTKVVHYQNELDGSGFVLP